MFFNKDIEEVHNRVEEYLKCTRYDKARIIVLAEMLLKLESEIIPKWELDNLGYYEVSDLKLFNKQQWFDTLSTNKGMETILFRLKSQDTMLERYNKIITGE